MGLKWPNQEEEPLNEFNEVGLICKCFPHLFPYGIYNVIINFYNK